MEARGRRTTPWCGSSAPADRVIGTSETRLVTLRGNSGVGKTSVARAVRASRPRGEVALLSQDVVRREVLGAPDVPGTPAIDLLDLMARFALDRGISVVLEGILVPERYGDLLRALVRDHRGVTLSYLWDVPFEETVRRHATKQPTPTFGESEMRTWWNGHAPVEGLAEHLIPAERTADGATRRILDDCGWA
jgi:predicted kinase